MNKILISVITIMLFSCDKSDNLDKKLEQIYVDHEVTGSFVLYDFKQNRYLFVNPERVDDEFLPASTFKIIHSLIALEEKIIPDENHIEKWDGIKRDIPVWNKDHDLKSAFKNSVVWYYQRLAKKIGSAKMKIQLSILRYGNGNLSAGIDSFWLKGGFRVTQEQQIDLLVRLYDKDLPFSPRTIEIVKRIMISEKNSDYVIRSKTGMTVQDNKTIGWYIGYIEKGDTVIFFANNIEKQNPDKTFSNARIDIAKEILKELDII